MKSVGIRLMREHAANRFDQIKAVSFSEGVLSLAAERPTKTRIVLHATAPLVIENSSNARATLTPGWDGMLGYSLYALELDVPAAGNVAVKINSVPPPRKPIPNTPAELDAFVQKLTSRTSRFPNDPAGFRRWQVAYRAKLAEWLMGGGWPERVPLETQVFDTRGLCTILAPARAIPYPDRPNEHPFVINPQGRSESAAHAGAAWSRSLLGKGGRGRL